MVNEFQCATMASLAHVYYNTRLFLFIMAVFLTLLFSSIARADFQPLTLPDLFENSDLIVMGVIKKVDDTTFTLQQSETFTDGTENITFVVKKYSNWFGGHRWSTYRTGQTVLLFLERLPDGDNATSVSWQIRGLGGEGEMPIEDGAVFVHGVNLKGFQREKHKLNDDELYSYRFDMRVFTSALKGYSRCYGLPLTATEKGMDVPTSTPQCSESERASYRKTSRLHCYLAKATSLKND